MKIKVTTTYSFVGTTQEILNIYNQALRPYITNGPNEPDLLLVMENRIRYFSQTEEFKFNLQHLEKNEYQIKIEILSPSTIVPILENLYSQNSKSYWQQVMQENELHYANMSNS